MKMVSIFLFAWAATHYYQFDVWFFSAAQSAQSLCIWRAHLAGSLHEVVSAVVCGERLTAFSQLKQSAVNLGLIHLFVVSGAHLGFFAGFLEAFSKMPSLQKNRHRVPTRDHSEYRFLLNFGLLAFVLLTGAGGPVLRAFLQRLLRQTSQTLRHHGHLSIFFAGLICLFLFSSKVSGVSLALSWSCAIVIWLTQNSRHLFRSAALYIGIFPVMCLISAPHPVSIFVNTALLPIFSAVLFPALLMVWLIPSLHPMLTPIWQLLQELLVSLGTDLPTISLASDNELANLLGLTYVFVLQIFVHIFHCHQQRSNLRGYSSSAYSHRGGTKHYPADSPSHTLCVQDDNFRS